MKNDMSAIINIRRLKSDKAQRVSKQAEQSLNVAKNNVENALAQVDEFKKQISTMERDLLLELLKKSVSVGAILDVERKMKNAEKEAQRLVEEVTKARDEEEQARNMLKEKKNLLRQAEGKLNRFNELHAHLQKEQKMKNTVAEEAVIDEFVETTFKHKR